MKKGFAKYMQWMSAMLLIVVMLPQLFYAAAVGKSIVKGAMKELAELAAKDAERVLAKAGNMTVEQFGHFKAILPEAQARLVEDSLAKLRGLAASVEAKNFETTASTVFKEIEANLKDIEKVITKEERLIHAGTSYLPKFEGLTTRLESPAFIGLIKEPPIKLKGLLNWLTISPELGWEHYFQKEVKASWLQVFSLPHFVMNMVSAVGFMLPNFLFYPLETMGQRRALYNTINSPQYFGGCWMQIPSELINSYEPQNTLPVYMSIPNDLINNDLVKSMKEGNRVIEVPTARYAECDYFVCWGDYQTARQFITDNTSGQMLSLKTGYLMYGDGTAVNPHFPAIQLLGEPQEPIYNDRKKMPVVGLIRELAGKIRTGTPYRQSQGLGQQSYLATAAGSHPVGSPLLADLFYSANENVPPKILESTLKTLKKDFGTVSGITLTPFTAQATADIARFSSSYIHTVPDFVYEAYATYLYEYQSPEIKALRETVSKDPSKAGMETLLTSYVVALDDLFAVVPARVPVTILSKKDVASSHAPEYAWNPRVKYLYNLTFDYCSTVDSARQIVLLTPEQKELISKTCLTFPRFSSIKPQLDAIKGLVLSVQKKGPFTFGTVSLTIPKELAQDPELQKLMPIYEIRATQESPGVLEGSLIQGYSDFVVPMASNSDLLWLPSSNVKYFISLVSSRYYTAQMVPPSDSDMLTFYVVACDNKPRLLLTDQYYEVMHKTDSKPAVCTPIFGPAEAPRYTLYMDWQLNPYNAPLIQKMVEREVRPALLQVIMELYSSLSQDKTKNIAGAIAVWLSQALTETGLVDYDVKTADLQKVAVVLVKRIKDMLHELTITQEMSIASIIDHLKANANGFYMIENEMAPLVNNNKGAMESFSKLPQAAVAADLPKPNKQEALRIASQGKIPLAGQYFYRELTNAKAWGGNVSLANYVEKNNHDLYQRIISSFDLWKAYMLATMHNWSLYQAAQPFEYTKGRLENVVLQATGIEDIAQGVYIYTSSYFPNEYLIVSASQDSKSFTAEPLNPFKPQPYLVSLSTGIVYENKGLSLEKVNAERPDNLLVSLEQITALPTTLKSAIQASYAHVAEQQKKQYFYTFTLLADPLSGKGSNAYVYMDITAHPEMQVDDALVNAKNFFICARNKNSTYVDYGCPLDEKADVLINLMSGAIYQRRGFVRFFEFVVPEKSKEFSTDPQAMFTNILLLLSPLTIRSEITNALHRLIEGPYKHYLEHKAQLRQNVKKEEQFLLDASLARNLAEMEFLTTPYSTLKKVGSNYYAVVEIGDKKTALDYNVSEEKGALFDLASKKSLSIYTGWVLDALRKTAGVAVVDNKQVLSMPQLYPSIVMQTADGLSTMVPAHTVFPGIDDTKTIAGTVYSLYYNTYAHAFFVKVVTNTPHEEYFLDVVGGGRFEADGSVKTPTFVFAQAQGTKNHLCIFEDLAGNPQVLFESVPGEYRLYDFSEYKTVADKGKLAMLYDKGSRAGVALAQHTNGSAGYDLYKVVESGDKTKDVSLELYDTYTSKASCTHLSYVRTSPREQLWLFDADDSAFNKEDEMPLIVFRNDKGVVDHVLYRQHPDTETYGLFVATPRGESLYDMSLEKNELLAESKKQLRGWVFADKLEDHYTKAPYSAIASKDNGTTVYLRVMAPPTKKEALTELYTKLGWYITIDSNGEPRIVAPFSRATLRDVTLIKNVPESYNEFERTFKNQSSISYDPTLKRYLYRFRAKDQTQPYYSVGGDYVDLVTGALFTSKGVPFMAPQSAMALSLAATDLLALLEQLHVIIPVDENDNAIVDTSGEPYTVWRF